ncbi:triosephosphate isomerase [Archaeoglobus sulfaticallidus PM70-1]|uniref:Triosephosphate isomerase n=1 Tax=Archaeoglobus sulfaticallidus PM70-1 TaxID=387631 RepID=N0BBV5_9EURY|nr:triose-phosphate isomerase [Archaeoglobus sulfaticallidus]AGK61089.1 triosephosphate isomerase [Archaeoglobus sulfaticallidus PM70-1]
MGIIVINFKAYKEGSGKKALELAKIVEEISSKVDDYIAIAPNFLDMSEIMKAVDVDVYAQHVDAIEYGSHTGRIVPEMLKDIGLKGSLINHSERRLKLADIDFVIEKFRNLGLTSIVCTNNVATTAAAAALGPDFVAIEPPELIGSGIPVSKADPEIVRNSVEAVKKVNSNVKVLCGAGISKHEDYVTALDLGTEGVLLASGIVKAKDPRFALEELVGLK